MKIRLKVGISSFIFILLVIAVGGIGIYTADLVGGYSDISHASNMMMMVISADEKALYEYHLIEDSDELAMLREEIDVYDEVLEMWIEALIYGTDSAEFKSGDAYETWADGGYEEMVHDVTFHPLISKKAAEVKRIREESEDAYLAALNSHAEAETLKVGFAGEYGKEKEMRYAITDVVFKTESLTLAKDLGEVKYYSKEALYQYRDEKHVNIWLDSITKLKNDTRAAQDSLPPGELAELLDSYDEYYATAQIMGNLVLDIEQKEAEELASYELVAKGNDEVDRFAKEMHQISVVLENEARTRAAYMLLGAVGISILMGLGLSFVFSRNILEPISQFQKSVREIAEGNLDQQVEVSLGDEIGELAMGFNDMTYKLKKSHTKRKEATENLEKAHVELEETYAELEEAHEELKDVDRIKDDIISNVSHELRTPITIVKGAIEMSRDEEDVEMRNKLYSVALGALIKQNRIVGNLVEMAQFRKHKFELNLEEIKLDHVVLMAIGEIKRDAEGKEIKVETEVPDVSIIADFGGIKLVLLNLLDNAIKFTDIGGHIKVKADVKGNEAWVCVEDEGIGVPEEFRDKVFDKLFQLDATSTRKFAGTGMGLAVAKEIVEAHGGKIWVEGKKKGSRLCFTVPLREGE